jgi:hypothetical protein
MTRTRRDRDAERHAIQSAARRLLAGTPLRSTSGALTVTELITESRLRRDVVYDHRDLVDDYTAAAEAQHSTPAAFQQLAAGFAATQDKLRAPTRELADQRALTSSLRKVVAELSLELQQARDELLEERRVTKLSTAAGFRQYPSA